MKPLKKSVSEVMADVRILAVQGWGWDQEDTFIITMSIGEANIETLIVMKDGISSISVINVTTQSSPLAISSLMSILKSLLILESIPAVDLLAFVKKSLERGRRIRERMRELSKDSEEETED